MKTYLKRIAFVAIIMGALSLIFFSGCEKEDENGPDSVFLKKIEKTKLVKDVEVGEQGSGAASIMLVAGQQYEAGSVFFSDIDSDDDGISDALSVTYQTDLGWFLSEIHFWIGNAKNEMPLTGADNPKIGQFPYSFKELDGITEFTFIIPFSDFGFACGSNIDVFAASHASVYHATDNGGVQQETAWGAGDRINEQGNWAMYVPIYIRCGTEQKPLSLCNNACAFGDLNAFCFNSYPSLIDHPSKWGWTNGPLKAGAYDFDLVIEAGQCEISKGRVVGSVFIEYSEKIVSVSYVLVDMNYSLQKIHLYVGSQPFPLVNGKYTCEPGSYPIVTNEIPNPFYHKVLLDGFEGDIYVIANATVCGFERRVELTEVIRLL